MEWLLIIIFAVRLLLVIYSLVEPFYTMKVGS